MVGSRTRSQTSVSRKEMRLASDVQKERLRAEKCPLVRLKKYKVKARRCDIRLNGSIENQLRSLFQKCRGHSGGRNTRDRIRGGINNLVNNGIFMIVSENKIELRKQVKLTFVPSSDFEIRQLDGNNNSFVESKTQSEDISEAGCCDDSDYDEREAPEWSREPALSCSLMSQQEISPDTIFAEQSSIRPEDLAQMFPQSAQGRDIWNSPPRAVFFHPPHLHSPPENPVIKPGEGKGKKAPQISPIKPPDNLALSEANDQPVKDVASRPKPYSSPIKAFRRKKSFNTSSETCTVCGNKFQSRELLTNHLCVPVANINIEQ